MPYEVKKSDQCPESKPWACIKSGDGEVMGCHETEAAAQDQMAALMASEKSAVAAEARKKAGEARAERYDQLRSKAGRDLRLQERVPIGQARSAAFPARQMRASLEEYKGSDKYHLAGQATVFNKLYEMWDFFGPYEEYVGTGAADETLAADPDVAFLVNHRGLTMARTASDTMKLAATKEALEVDAWVNPKRTDVKDLVLAIDDGDITEMSFAFRIDEGWWSDDFMTFKIAKFDIHRGDVSAVNYGANPFTSIAARQQEILREIEYLPKGAQREVLRRLERYVHADFVRHVDETQTVTTSSDVTWTFPDQISAPPTRQRSEQEATLREIEAFMVAEGARRLATDG